MAVATRRAGPMPAPSSGGRSGMRNELALGFALALGLIAIASAQSYPSRPVTMVVPFAAGGPADTIGRIVPDGMRAPLGQPVIVENVAGASGTIGVGRVAAASADGYWGIGRPTS